MGGQASKKQCSFRAKDEKTVINVRVEICSSWGYGAKESSVEKFCQYLSEKGITSHVAFEPKSGGRNEFFIYQIQNDQEKIIFSNNKKNSDAVISSRLSSDLYDSIIEKIAQ